MNDLTETAPAFIEMAHRIVWATAVTVDSQSRPRSRILHPIWQWDGHSLTGWIATSPTPIKKAHLGSQPYMSINYWQPNHDTCVAECRASLLQDDANRTMVWDLLVNTPEPVGYDPTIIPAWTSPTANAFAVIKLEPWRPAGLPRYHAARTARESFCLAGSCTELNPDNLLAQRLERPSPGLFDIHTTLRHFALINYAVPAERLRPHIPTTLFDIPEYEINGRPMALLSVVPFVDTDFRYIRLAPWLQFRFPQTNYRVYVIDRRTQEPVVWFFGTTLGSPIVYLARTLWGIPWYYGRYQVDCTYGDVHYTKFSYRTQSKWGTAEIEIEDSGQPITPQPGFDDLETMRLILTHPVTGYYYRLNGQLGSYTIWHKLMEMTLAQPNHLYFSLLERLAVLNRDEMEQPHSIFICPKIDFDIHLPPIKIDG